jgi:hypothetical protein
MNAPDTDNIQLSENFILADADYLDRVVLNLTVNFERMLNRKIPRADLSQWAVDVALDGGLRADGTAHETQLMLLYDERHPQLDNFNPSGLADEINGKAFKDEHLGEFIVNAYPTGKLVDKDEYMLETLRTLVAHPEVKRIMLVPDSEEGDLYDRLRHELRHFDDENRHVTIFAMQPLEGGNFKQENLGFSLTDSLGVRSEEFRK